MTIIFAELKEKLKQFDEVLLLELLEINAEQLLERFTDVIEEKYDELLKEVE